jgi:four helix bundle protein
MRNPARTYRDLVVWQKAMAATGAIYRVTRGFPPEERYGLSSQIRKSAVSIPSNIAEGFGRRARGEYVRFLLISRGSLFELETQLQVASEAGFITPEDYARLVDLVDEVERMLESLIRRVDAAIRDSPPPSS